MITTHVLDIAQGRPAVGVAIVLEARQANEWTPIGRGLSDAKGRLSTLTDGMTLAAGAYRLTFDLGAYHRGQGIEHPFFPEAQVAFHVHDASQHYHVPLVISPFGYSTYRGT